MMQSIFSFLAQTPPPAGGGGQPAGGTGSPGGGAGPNLFFSLMLAMIVFYIFLFRGQGKKKRETKKMIDALKKNDRVLTVGGIIGTVVSTKGDEITLRVDESSNIKMIFVRRSIQSILSDQSTNTE